MSEAQAYIYSMNGNWFYQGGHVGACQSDTLEESREQVLAHVKRSGRD